MRRTKADAEQTRQQILAAARRVFAEKGVARTSLEQIAAAAGLTRGAIYWHFANKTELFYAMREQVSLPLVDRMGAALLGQETEDPLTAVEESLLEVLKSLETDEQVRETFGIVSLKCEYVGEFDQVPAHILRNTGEWAERLARSYACAARRGLMRIAAEPEVLALESQAFIFGLVRLWLMDSAGNSIRPKARDMIHAHVAMRRQ